MVTEALRHRATVNSGIIPLSETSGLEISLTLSTCRRRKTTSGPRLRKAIETSGKMTSGLYVARYVARYPHISHSGMAEPDRERNAQRNTLKHVKSVLSGIFTLAKQQDYFQGETPHVTPQSIIRRRKLKKPMPTVLEEIQTILSVLTEPAGTAFAVAAFMGLRHREIHGLLRENYRDGEWFVFAPSGMAMLAIRKPVGAVLLYRSFGS